ncbi:hypothetical protein BJ508DRAFT_324455 [Ascobolus immersus RN42]|uniref:Uncharacterized protein n=1 Tax=Ascobolus immersus RN42 TaxID=1160509 RepID=A0A3N4ID77_ASCIM|nr:hypothetical protein BJ508DRAFT_324455 [Ascobolus immersus RN42]
MYSTPYVSPRIGTSGYIRTPSPPPIPSRDETRAGRQSATSQRSGRSHRSRFEKIRERIEQEATSQRSSPASKRSSPVGLEGLVRGQHVRAESASTVRSPVGSPLSFNSPLGSPVGSPTQAQAQMGVGKRGTFGVGEPMSPVTREARLQFYRGGGQ